MKYFRSTTILGVRHKNSAAIGGDGQVTIDSTIMKEGANKIRKIYNDKVLVGFAGKTADALTLFGRFEDKLSEFNGNLSRAAVELAKDWRTDRVLRRLEALLIAIDKEHSFIISGSGDIIEPDDGIVAIGSGGPYALAAARALIKYSDLDCKATVEEAIKIAASICVYTNKQIKVATL
jgi:ATP-dependent HslUV protease subunit HslV